MVPQVCMDHQENLAREDPKEIEAPTDDQVNLVLEVILVSRENASMDFREKRATKETLN